MPFLTNAFLPLVSLIVLLEILLFTLFSNLIPSQDLFSSFALEDIDEEVEYVITFEFTLLS